MLRPPDAGERVLAINYIGSKLSLLPAIRAILDAHDVEAGTFCDLFSGTGIVAQMARLIGHTVISNDWQHYSCVLQQAYLRNDGYPSFATLLRAQPDIARTDADVQRLSVGLAPVPASPSDTRPLRHVLAYLENLPPQAGPFYHAYCAGGDAGRSYFSAENGMRAESIRNQIESWRAAGWLSEGEWALLVASLLETMDQLANTASVYGAYLKQLKKSAQAPLRLRLLNLAPSDGRRHRCFQQDGATLLGTLADEGELDVLYLDPPYNQRQYSANYHLLETLARWDLNTFTPRGKTGLRPAQAQRSAFCSRREVKDAFQAVLTAARARHILVSYNDEGLLDEEDLKQLLRDKARGGTVDFRCMPYKRFRADQDREDRRYRGDAVREFLFYARVNPEK